MDRQRVNEVFELALGVEPSARAALVERESGGDEHVRAGVMALLDALGRAGDFLASPTVSAAARAWEPAPERPASLAGCVLGPYKLLELIGEGGFGSVYMADQTGPIRRRVAVKVLKPGMDSRLVVARFEAERQALALMDHPNIARVFDAGTTAPELGSLPYFVMELVRGVPITRYCDEARLDLRERLGLLAPVCRAVQHAHSKGVIHRDIKPSNVLVTLHDGVAVPKVIDFGIAKATGPALTERTVFTEFRALVGTPAYMSPEQAEMSGLDVDTRSDVYSLGVLMYELLTGSTPFDTATLMRAGLAEMQRIIREEEPARPSTRLSTAGDSLRSIAEERRTPPERLGRFVRGELDWIVMKALEKDRARRYGTAEAMAEDIGRYLTGEAVVAAPPSRAYGVRKFVRRHRGPVVATAALVAVLAGGVAGTTRGLVEARRERDAARAAEERAAEAAQAAQEALREAEEARVRESSARRVAEDGERRALVARQLIDWGLGFAAQRPPEQPPMTVAEMLTVAEQRIGERFAADPRAEAEARFTLAGMLVQTGEFWRAEGQLALVRPLWEAHGPPDLPTLARVCDLAQLVVLARMGSMTETVPWFELMQRALLAELGAQSPDLEAAARAVLRPVSGAEAEAPHELSLRVDRLTALVAERRVDPGTLVALATTASWAGAVVIAPPERWPLFPAYARGVDRLVDVARARGAGDPMLTMCEYGVLGARMAGGVAPDTVDRARAVLARARAEYAVGSWPLAAAVQGVAGAIQRAGLDSSSPGLLGEARALHIEALRLQRALPRPFLADQQAALFGLLRFARDTGDTAVIDDALGPLPEGMAGAMARLPENNSEFSLVARQHVEDLLAGYEALRARGDGVDRGTRRLMGVYGSMAALAALRGPDDAAIAEPMVRFARVVGAFIDDLREPVNYAQVHLYTTGAAFAAFVPDEAAALEFAARVRELAPACGGPRDSTIFNAAFQPFKARVARGDEDALRGWEGVLDEAIAAGPPDEMTDDIALELARHLAQKERWEDLRRVRAKLARWYADPAGRIPTTQMYLTSFQLALLPNASSDDLLAAHALAERAMATNVERDRAALALGIAFTRLGRHAEAIGALDDAERAAAANPQVTAWTRAYTFLFRARASAMLGRVADAEADLRRLVEVRIARAARADPFPTFARGWLDEGLATLGPAEAARLGAILEQWKPAASDLNGDAWSVVSRPGDATSDIERALAWAREAASLAPNEASVQNTLGIALYRAGRDEEAIATLRRSDEVNATAPRGRQVADLVFLALAHHRLGRQPEATSYAAEARRLAREAGASLSAEDKGFIAELDGAMVGE